MNRIIIILVAALSLLWETVSTAARLDAIELSSHVLKRQSAPRSGYVRRIAVFVPDQITNAARAPHCLLSARLRTIPRTDLLRKATSGAG